MKYQIVFSKELEVNIDEFVKEWNADKACSDLAIIQREKNEDGRQFSMIPNEIIMLLNESFVQGVAAGVAANMLYDFIKAFFKNRGFSVNVKSKNNRLSVDHLPL